MIGRSKLLRLTKDFQDDMVGSATLERAVTATLYVSPNGSGVDGSTWATAYTTIQDALDAASSDADDLTLILIGPHATNYDIDTTGDPSWSKDVILKGSHRNWAKVVNGHDTATSVLKFTGRVSLIDLTIDCGAGSNNGVIISGAGTKGSRVRHVYFECEDVTGAHTALELEDTEYLRLAEVKFHGVVAQTTALLLDDCKLSNFDRLDFHDCLVGIQITDTSPSNIWSFILVSNCALGVDIDSGNFQFFHEFAFGGNTRNVDDEVGNHAWISPRGAFDIEILPDNLTGSTVNTGAANTYGSDTELLSAVSRDNPFRIVGTHMEPSTSEWYQLRFSDDAGTTFFDIIQFDGTKREGQAALSGTEHIFNKGTRISASARDISGGDNVKVWLEIQEV